MAAFEEPDWSRVDYWAIVECGGLGVISAEKQQLCGEWLASAGYAVSTLDMSAGLDSAVSELGRLFDWEGQFGYTLRPDSRNLNALHDGFAFNVPHNGGMVFEIIGGERAWQEDPQWFTGLLAICKEHCRYHLALGKRFFSLLVLPDGSPLIGTTIHECKIPVPFWSPALNHPLNHNPERG